MVAQLDGNIPTSTLGFGIEFPSDRMWKYLNKGTHMDEVLETLEFCMQSGFKVNANVILGWNNLIEQDLKDLEGFMDNLSEQAVTTLQLRWLFAHPYTKIYDTYDRVPIHRPGRDAAIVINLEFPPGWYLHRILNGGLMNWQFSSPMHLFDNRDFG